MNLPIDLYDVLERHLGHDDSRTVAKVIERSLDLIENRSQDLAGQRKLEIMEQMRDELVTREYLHRELEAIRKEMDATRKEIDIARKEMLKELEIVRKDVKVELAQFDKKFSLYFMALLFAVLFVNKDAITLLGSLLGLVKT